MEKINWGIIGCGDVTELKSGPAFNKVNHSSLVAVMRRNEEKVKDYAARHHVPKWYTDAAKLINDPDINAIYVATPPSTHEEYTIAAIDAGKQVYVEKPMSVNADSATRMAAAAKQKNIKLTVAHYRRAQPLFKKIKQLIDDKVIGEIRLVRSAIHKKPLSKEELLVPKTAWRVDKNIAGGGLFHDLAPHQLDLMYYFFGEVEKISGFGTNQAGLYNADDMVTRHILFKNKTAFTGSWCFNVAESEEKDVCKMTGDKGMISFSFFDHKPITVRINGNTESFSFEPLQHVQQPMIEKVVEFFRGEGKNPCAGEEGVQVMKMIDL